MLWNRGAYRTLPVGPGFGSARQAGFRYSEVIQPPPQQGGDRQSGQAHSERRDFVLHAQRAQPRLRLTESRSLYVATAHARP